MAKRPSNPSHPAAALKAVRIERGLTLRALSARIDMPYSTLSKLENGKMEMTYDKLLRLAQGLGVDLGALLAGAPVVETPAAVGRRSVSRAGRSAGATSDIYSHQYPAADLLGKLMVPIIIDIKARSVEDMGGLVRHSGEEYLYVVKGTMEIHSNLYAPLALGPGDSTYFDSGMAHAYVRTSEAPCVVLTVCTGPGIQRLAQSAAHSWTLAGPFDDDRSEADVSDIET